MLPRAKTPISSSIKQLRLWMIWMDIIKPFPLISVTSKEIFENAENRALGKKQDL